MTQITAIEVQAELPVGSPTIFELLGLDATFAKGARAAMDAGVKEDPNKAMNLLKAVQALPASLRSKIVYLYSPLFILRAQDDKASQVFSLTANPANPTGQSGSVPVSTFNGHTLLDFGSGTVGMKASVDNTKINGNSGVAIFSVFRVTGNPSGGSATVFGLRSESTTYSTRPELISQQISTSGVVQHVMRRSQQNSGALQTISESGAAADGQFHRHLTVVDGTLATGTYKAYKDNVLVGSASNSVVGTIGLFSPAFIDFGAFFGTGGPRKAPVESALHIVLNAVPSETEQNALDALGIFVTAPPTA